MLYSRGFLPCYLREFVLLINAVQYSGGFLPCYLREFELQGIHPPKNEYCTVKLRFAQEGEKKMKIFFENLIFAQGEQCLVSSSLLPNKQARQEYSRLHHCIRRAG
jgi:hypothetical protein